MSAAMLAFLVCFAMLCLLVSGIDFSGLITNALGVVVVALLLCILPFVLRKRRCPVDEMTTPRFREILGESLQLMESTVYPKTFFGRYRDAMEQARRILEISQVEEHRRYAREILDDLVNNRESWEMEFISRCEKRGRLYAVQDELLSGEYDLSPAAIAHLRQLLQKREAEEIPPESGEYIYCSVSFGGEKTYYYRTEDESLACGDEVVVPVGNNGRKSVGSIVEIRRYPVGKTPFPPGGTKKILGRCPTEEE